MSASIRSLHSSLFALFDSHQQLLIEHSTQVNAALVASARQLLSKTFSSCTAAFNSAKREATITRATLRSNIHTLEAEIEQLKSSNAELRVDSASAPSPRRGVDDDGMLSSSVMSVPSPSKTSRQHQQDQLQLLESYRLDITRLHQMLESEKQERRREESDAERTLSEQQRILAASVSENTQLREQLLLRDTSISEDDVALSAARAQLVEEVERLSRDQEAAAREKEQLQEQLEAELLATRSRLEQSVQFAQSDAEKERAALMDQLASVQQELATKNREHDKKLSGLEELVGALRAEHKDDEQRQVDLQGRLDVAATEAESVRAKNQQLDDALKAAAAEHDASMEKMTTEIKRLSEENTNTQKDARSRVERLEATIKAMREQSSADETSLKAAAERAASDAAARITSLEQERAQLQGMMSADKETALQRARELEEDCAKLHGEMESSTRAHSAEVSELNSRLAQLEADHQQQKTEQQLSHQGALESLAKEREQVESELKRSLSEHAATEAERYADVSARLEAATADVESLRAKNAQLVADAERQRACSEDSMRELQSEVERLSVENTRIAELEKAMETLREQTEMDQASFKADAERAALDGTQREDELTKKCDALAREVASLKGENEMLQTEARALESSLKMLRSVADNTAPAVTSPPSPPPPPPPSSSTPSPRRPNLLGASSSPDETRRKVEREMQAQRDHMAMVERLEKCPDRDALLAAFEGCSELPGLWELRNSRWANSKERRAGAPEITTLELDGKDFHVTKIDISGQRLSGSLRLEKLPPRLTWLDVSSNKFSCELDLSALGTTCKHLRWIYLFNNPFYGKLDLGHLPSTLVHFYAYQTNFSGPVSFSSLPVALEELNINSSRLEGQLSIDSSLPPNLRTLNLHNNSFSGELVIAGLPDSLRWISVRANQLEGQLEWSALPRKLLHLDIAKNRFKGTLRCADLPRSLQRFCCSDNLFDALTDFSALPPEIVHVDISDNAFSGSVLLRSLPSSLLSLNISCNSFSGNLDCSHLPSRMHSLDISKNNFSQSLSLKALPASLRVLHAHSNDFTCEISDFGSLQDLDVRWCPHVTFEEDPVPAWVRVEHHHSPSPPTQ